jgi:hypothetical protein
LNEPPLSEPSPKEFSASDSLHSGFSLCGFSRSGFSFRGFSLCGFSRSENWQSVYYQNLEEARWRSRVLDDWGQILKDRVYVPGKMRVDEGGVEIISSWREAFIYAADLGGWEIYHKFGVSGESSLRKIKQLIKAGANVDLLTWIRVGLVDGSSSRLSLLQLAIQKEDVDLARLLLQGGARVTGLAEALTELSACGSKRLAMVQLLLDYGADVNQAGECSSFRKLPLMVAPIKCFSGESTSLFERLIALGADVNALSPLDYTPLGLAAAFGDLNRCRLLVAHGADINLPNSRGQTPLMVLLTEYVTDSAVDVVRFLLDEGADVNLADHEGETPLMVAVRDGEKELIQILLEHRADLYAVNNRGQSALSVAEEMRGHRHLLELLVSH